MAILSINSHVAYGRVGNAVSVFALQRMGRDVWPVHTTLLSNHPGHGRPRGPVVAPAAVREQIAGLAEIGVLGRCDAVLSGYLGDAGSAAAVAEAVGLVKAANPAALYLCDPVIGDLEAGQYVADAIRAAIAQTLMPIADIATPNTFELGVLAGVAPPATLKQAMAAAERLAPATVIATGLPVADGKIATLACTPDGALSVQTPRLGFARRPDGAGDLFAALALGRYLGRRRWDDAVAFAVSASYAVLDAALRLSSPVLPVIEIQAEIARPARRFDAHWL